MWSLGCIMAELLTKRVLFQGTGELDQIDKIFKVTGSPTEETWPGYKKLPNVQKVSAQRPHPGASLRAVVRVSVRYRSHDCGCAVRGLPCCSTASPPGGVHRRQRAAMAAWLSQEPRTLSEWLEGWAGALQIKLRFQPRTLRDALPVASKFDPTSGLTEVGLDLIEQMLTLDPAKRISAQDALNHPW